MDSNNTKSGKEIDVRDAAGYLLSKVWIIALVTICAVIASFLITSFTTPMYTSTSKVILYNKNTPTNNTVNGNLNASDFTIAIQLTQMSPEIFTGDEFAKRVASLLNEDEGPFNAYLSGKHDYENDQRSFKQFYGGTIPDSVVKKSLSVVSDVDTCSITLSSRTTDQIISTIIVNAASSCLQQHIKEIIDADSVRVGNIDSGKVSNTPSNIHYPRNMALGAVLGFVIICAILLAFYIFDDKIKTPDDIEKHLALNVLGEIPEIEEEE